MQDTQNTNVIISLISQSGQRGRWKNLNRDQKKAVVKDLKTNGIHGSPDVALGAFNRCIRGAIDRAMQ